MSLIITALSLCGLVTSKAISTASNIGEDEQLEALRSRHASQPPEKVTKKHGRFVGQLLAMEPSYYPSLYAWRGSLDGLAVLVTLSHLESSSVTARVILRSRKKHNASRALKELIGLAQYFANLTQQPSQLFIVNPNKEAWQVEVHPGIQLHAGQLSSTDSREYWDYLDLVAFDKDRVDDSDHWTEAVRITIHPSAT